MKKELNEALLSAKEMAALYTRIKKLEAALREIAKGEGAFSRDPLEHASNTIDSMKGIAKTALDEGGERERFVEEVEAADREYEEKGGKPLDEFRKELEEGEVSGE